MTFRFSSCIELGKIKREADSGKVGQITRPALSVLRSRSLSDIREEVSDRGTFRSLVFQREVRPADKDK